MLTNISLNVTKLSETKRQKKHNDKTLTTKVKMWITKNVGRNLDNNKNMQEDNR